jgi:WD40 repeat protein
MKTYFLIAIINLFVAQTLAQFQVQTKWDGKQLALNPVWSRVADIYGEAGSIESVEFSKDSRFIVSGSKFDNTVIMWRTSDGLELWRQTLPQEIERVAWSPDGKMVASCSEDFLVRIFDAKNGKILHELKHRQGIDGLAWSHNSLYLASGEENSRDGNGNLQGFLTLFKMPEATKHTQIDFGETINSIDFSLDDHYVLAAGHWGQLNVYTVPELELVKEFRGDPKIHFISARFSPDMKLIACGDNDGNYYIWEFNSGNLVRKFDRSGHKVEIVDWTPDGKYLATAGNDPFIRFFRTEDILSGDRIYTALQVHAGDQAEYLDFNSNGSMLVSAHQDGVIRLWIVMSEDPTVNKRRHEWVKEKQKKAAEID